MLNIGHNPPRGGVSGRGQGLPAGKSNYWPQSAYHAHHPYGFPLGGVREGGEKRLHKLILLVGRRDADAASLQSAKLPPLCWIQLAIVKPKFSPSIFSFSPLQVTLHSNMQKVIELSQSVVVDKSLMERFEEIQRQTKLATTAASSTSIMMASETETEMEVETETETATMEFGMGRTTRTTTTKSISMCTTCPRAGPRRVCVCE